MEGEKISVSFFICSEVGASNNKKEEKMCKKKMLEERRRKSYIETVEEK